MRLLLVEDDNMIGEALSLALKDAAYSVDWVRNGADATLTIEQGEHQAVLLDLGLPKLDGLEVLRVMRAHGNNTPVIIITARDGVESRIKGLDLGADDYLIKPFDISELLARLRAIVRRQAGQTTTLFKVGDLELDTATHQARFAHQQALLSPKEFSLLQTLILSPGRIFSRSELEERVYGWNEEVESNAIDFLIHGIRKKLSNEAIKNLRGAGWMVHKA
ncbi:MAG: response regulator transcription factor [Proteobacteria bacterium]|nr:response regulator transcription factor [Pseudomonadota bacterium]